MENDSDSRCPTRLAKSTPQHVCSPDCEAIHTLREIFEDDELLAALMNEDADIVVEASTILQNAEKAAKEAQQKNRQNTQQFIMSTVQ
ncbi:hypothetical protein QR680_002600 [Steinernema hermaphroditum]|uniref:Uncharacterized protein n=1 Tax=Steinernema hermaphroditum TaxID=289476 RepID=A0AA39H3B8_9BILA|nr:hypothetical protein QR680_002600 [Steinernema hermaphroditum]